MSQLMLLLNLQNKTNLFQIHNYDKYLHNENQQHNHLRNRVVSK